MSFLMGKSGAKAPPPKPGNIDPVRSPSNQRGVAMRYFAGTQRLGITWLGPAYNQKSVAVKQKMGKKSETIGYNYFADVVGVFGLGPGDILFNVVIDDETLWSGPVTRSGDSVTITIPARGTMTLYWGTSTQGIDSTLAPFGHPAYRNQIYAVFKRLLFGQDRTTAPTIQIDIFRHTENPLGLTTPLDYGNGAFVPAIAAELLCNPNYGLNWNPATLDLTSFDAVRSANNADQYSIAPLIDTEDDANSIMKKLMEHVDGFLVPSRLTGSNKMGMGLTRQFSGDPSLLPFIGEYDMVAPPEWTEHDWNETPNEVYINFTDKDAKWETDSEPYRSAPSARISSDGKPFTADLTWITERFQAAKAAARAGRVQCVPRIEGKLEVRWRAVKDVRAGDFIVITYTHQNATLIFRVTRKTTETWRSTTVKLEVLCDGWYSSVLPFSPQEAGIGSPPTLPAPGAQLPGMPGFTPSAPAPPSAAYATKVIELPFPLVPASEDPSKPHVASLVARSTSLETRVVDNISEDNVSYRPVNNHRGLCFYGILANDLPDTQLGAFWDDGATGMLVNLAGADGLAANIPSTNEAGRQSDQLLAYVVHTGNEALNEFISFRTATVVSSTQVRLTGLLRSRCLGANAGHDAVGNYPVYIFARSDLSAFTDPGFLNGVTRYFKPAPSTEVQALDLASVTAQSLVLSNFCGRPPTPVNMAMNGDGRASSNPGLYSYVANSDVVLSWNLASWTRYSLAYALSQPARDPNLQTIIRIQASLGSAILREVLLGPGVTQYTYLGTDRVADFGSDPNFFLASVSAVVGRMESFRPNVQIFSKAGNATGSAAFNCDVWMAKAFMRVRGTVDPFTILERNFQIWSFVKGKTYGGAGATDYLIPNSLANLATNFTRAATLASLTLIDVTIATDVEAAVDENLRLMDASLSATVFYFQPTTPTFVANGQYWIKTNITPQEIRVSSAGSWPGGVGAYITQTSKTLGTAITPTGTFNANNNNMPGEVVVVAGVQYLVTQRVTGGTPGTTPGYVRIN